MPPEDSREFDDLSDYVRAAGRRWRLIAGGTAIVVAAAAGLTLLAPATYRTSALLLVTDSMNDQPQAARAATSLAQFIQIAQSRTVIAKAIATLAPGSCGSPRVEVLPLEGTRLMRVFATCTGAEAAARLANQVAAEAITVNRSLNDSIAARTAERLRERLREADARLKAAEDALRASPPAGGLEAASGRRDIADRGPVAGIGEELAARRLLREYTLAEEGYETVSRSLANVRSLAPVQSAELRVLDPAPVPGPLSPKLLLNVILAAVAGSILFTVLGLTLEFVHPRGRRRAAPRRGEGGAAGAELEL